MQTKETVSLRAFEARMRRHLAGQELKLMKRRGKEAERRGEYFALSGSAISFDADVRDLIAHGTKDGVLKGHEVVEILPGLLYPA